VAVTDTVGVVVGVTVGVTEAVGVTEGVRDGLREGLREAEGLLEGLLEGVTDFEGVGVTDGDADVLGVEEGLLEGVLVGVIVGVGVAVGEGEGGNQLKSTEAPQIDVVPWYCFITGCDHPPKVVQSLNAGFESYRGYHKGYCEAPDQDPSKSPHWYFEE